MLENEKKTIALKARTTCVVFSVDSSQQASVRVCSFAGGREEDACVSGSAVCVGTRGGEGARSL